MSVESAADRALFFDTGEFAVTAVWTRGGTPVSLSVILNDGATETSEFEGPPTIVHTGEILLRAEDLPAGAVKGDAITIAGQNYTAKSILPDGTGIVFVRLERVV